MNKITYIVFARYKSKYIWSVSVHRVHTLTGGLSTTWKCVLFPHMVEKVFAAHFWLHNNVKTALHIILVLMFSHSVNPYQDTIQSNGQSKIKRWHRVSPSRNFQANHRHFLTRMPDRMEPAPFRGAWIPTWEDRKLWGEGSPRRQAAGEPQETGDISVWNQETNRDYSLTTKPFSHTELRCIWIRPQSQPSWDTYKTAIKPTQLQQLGQEEDNTCC